MYLTFRTAFCHGTWDRNPSSNWCCGDCFHLLSWPPNTMQAPVFEGKPPIGRHCKQKTLSPTLVRQTSMAPRKAGKNSFTDHTTVFFAKTCYLYCRTRLDASDLGVSQWLYCNLKTWKVEKLFGFSDCSASLYNFKELTGIACASFKIRHSPKTTIAKIVTPWVQCRQRCYTTKSLRCISQGPCITAFNSFHQNVSKWNPKLGTCLSRDAFFFLAIYETIFWYMNVLAVFVQHFAFKAPYE